MEANPSHGSVLHLYFIRPSADPEQLLFFEGSFFFFLFLLLLIFSPHINYTDVLGAMCSATSQRKPQDFRSEEQPDVLAWQNTTRGSQLRLPDWAGCLCQTGWGHHLPPETRTTEEITSVQTHSSFWGLILLVFGTGFFLFPFSR